MAMNEYQSSNQPVQMQEDNSALNIKDLLFLYLSKWKWFVLSLAVCLCVAALYLLRTPAVYTRTANIIIEDNSKGGSVSSDLNFADMGLFQSNTNVNNEMISLKSPALMQEVVQRLHLTTNYSSEGRFHDRTLYGTTLPINVAIDGCADNESAGLTVKVNADSTIVLYGFIHNGGKLKGDRVKGRLFVPVETPLGKVTVTPTAFFQQNNSYEIIVNKSSLYSAATSYASRLKVSLLQREATVVSLSIEDVSIQRANDVLNTLISAYNENWIKAKNQIAVSTSVFINDRLGVIEKELGVVEEDISSYKSKNLIPDLQTASDMYVGQSSSIEAQILEINNRLYMLKYITDYLTRDSGEFQLLPAGTGIESSSIESQISEYNNMLLQRNNLVANSSSTNPLVVDMDNTLGSMRSAILTSLENYKVMLQTQLGTLKQQEAKATDRIAATPDQAKYLLSVERQQKVKEALYLFLLQKREENELSQAFTAYNTRVITPPTGSTVPTSPAKMQILLIAFVLGLAIPMGVFFLIETGNTRVRGKKDLERLTVPYIGEIPLYDKAHRRLPFRIPDIRGKKNDKEEKIQILVKDGERDIINEAFRVVRTNLEFMAAGNPKANVYMTTSFNPASGKTFVTVNMAMSLAIKGQKVLVIDGDMRHGSVSAVVGYPKQGLSDWLGNRAQDLDSLIVPSGIHDEFSILPCGTLPPNPTELLQDDRLRQLVDSLRSRYDYIFIDCPPINIVADTQIIGKVSDRTIFIVRAGLLERSMLTELENDFKEKKYPGMCMLLNGTASKGGRYGYCYGYQYGYNYGYGYYNS